MPASQAGAYDFFLKRLERIIGTARPFLRRKTTGDTSLWWAEQGIPGEACAATPVAGATNVAPPRGRRSRWITRVAAQAVGAA